jgi:hypothetical protein
MALLTGEFLGGQKASWLCRGQWEQAQKADMALDDRTNWAASSLAVTQPWGIQKVPLLLKPQFPL